MTAMIPAVVLTSNTSANRTRLSDFLSFKGNVPQSQSTSDTDILPTSTSNYTAKPLFKRNSLCGLPGELLLITDSFLSLRNTCCLAICNRRLNALFDRVVWGCTICLVEFQLKVEIINKETFAIVRVTKWQNLGVGRKELIGGGGIPRGSPSTSRISRTNQ
ncbi:hypothetical protein BKA61DRAFT_237197 [Leptodontidium sp. MPI-SDFR-AT-0119]|nr:hypothetical protein BKA61DRAFT_237197 [Leptodontidium sp. MPI-SDFR-AT-0119]